MIPAVHNFTPQYAGDTCRGLQFKMNFDITGAVILMQIKMTSSATSSKQFTIGSGIEIIDAINGTFRISPFINLLAGNYIYDIQFTLPNGEINTYVKGNYITTNDVSR